METKKKLVRSSTNKKIAGVCAGLANYFNIDPIIVRIVFLLLLLFIGGGLLLYIIGWIAMPMEETAL